MAAFEGSEEAHTKIVQHTEDSKSQESLFDSISGVPVAHAESNGNVTLSEEHRAFLIRRHGTIDLEPIPSSDPADPYNWPVWKKVTNLMLVSFHAMMTTFIASSIIPAFENIALDLNTSIVRASYLTSLQIAVLGFSPLFWKPISHRYGRRPIWLISTIGALLFNVGCALSHSYAAMGTCRAFASFFISPAGAIGSGVVTETFFKKQRAQYMGVWTLLVTLGPPAGPFFMGFVAQQTGNYRWIYWVLAIVNGVQFLAYLFLAPETRYVRPEELRGQPQATPSPTRAAPPLVVQAPSKLTLRNFLSIRRLDPTPLRWTDFAQPFTLFRHASILVPTLAYTFVFGFCSVLLTVEIPQIFVPKFGFNAQQIGLQFLGVIVGSIIGEQLGGRLSDAWMNRKTEKNRQHREEEKRAEQQQQQTGGAVVVESAGNDLPQRKRRPPPEFRLWLSYGGFVLVMVGLIVFGVRIQQAPQGKWNVTPIIGIAIAAVGNQLVTTVLVTYAIDCHTEHSSNIGVFVNLVRSTWGFIGPFWFPDMLASLGGSGSGGLMAGIVFLFSLVPIALLQWWNGSRRNRASKAEAVA